MRKDATFSGDRVYRYMLSRVWDDSLPALAIIGLNPSTADENIDDPTIRRCITFAKRDGYGGIIMLNLFAYRATNPKELKQADNPIGQHNNAELRRETRGRSILLAYGANYTGGRADEVQKLLGIDTYRTSTFCLGRTQAGHPLYLKSTTPMEPWEGHSNA